ncbi:MAG: glucose-6-phosphate isomerase [Gemmatimonadetes bacterium]|nr:glucose-6-phosphate isomerase [Gemmatimonadota bacterium]
MRLDTSLMFRDALDGVHGLDPAVAATLAARFPAVQAEVRERRAAGGYGFMGLGQQQAVAAAIETWAAERRGRYAHLLILGIGGSALGAKAMLSALKPAAWNEWGPDGRDGWPTLTVLDNVDPYTVLGALDRLDPRKTLVNVISKSGGTAETLAQYLIVREWLDRALGATAKDHIVVTTDPEKGPLRALVREEGLASFEVPSAVGGRFSVLTAVGLVPAALLGIDLTELLGGAQDALDEAESDDLATNPAARWAALQWQAQASRAANIHVLMPYSDRLREFAEWYRQLWAESLGKRLDRHGAEVFRGPTPVGAVGATDQHSQVQLFMEGPFDKTITFVRVGDTRDLLKIPDGGTMIDDRSSMIDDAGAFGKAVGYLRGQTLGKLLDEEFLATREALRSQGRMSATIEMDSLDTRAFGRLVMFFQLATGYAGVWYGIDPFDQPGVELGKVLTNKAMGK